jgi:2'-5' RNA ligase
MGKASECPLSVVVELRTITAVKQVLPQPGNNIESFSTDCGESLEGDANGPSEVRRHQPLDSSLLRLFLSFNPSPEIAARLAQAQITLRCLLERRYGAELPIRWTRSSQFHLTVLFFGNTSANKTDAIQTRLRQLVKKRPGFPCLAAKGFGCFPAFHRPRVLWVGFASNPSLQCWQDALAKRFASDFLSRRQDRSYPHVTIARLDFRRLPLAFGDHLFELAQEISMPSWDWPIDAISIMRAIPGPKGSEYVCLANFPPTHRT